MTVNRRNFLKTSAAAAAASALVTGRAGALTMPTTEPLTPPPVADLRDLAMRAIDAAKSAGAEYSDVRIAQNRSQFVQTRERRVQGLADNETFGMGVRALVNGAWGFVATADLSVDGVVAAARQAVVQAKANRAAVTRPITLAPYGAPQKGEWTSPIKVDPFNVPIADKVALLIAATKPRSRTARGSSIQE